MAFDKLQPKQTKKVNLQKWFTGVDCKDVERQVNEFIKAQKKVIAGQHSTAFNGQRIIYTAVIFYEAEVEQ